MSLFSDADKKATELGISGDDKDIQYWIVRYRLWRDTLEVLHEVIFTDGLEARKYAREIIRYCSHTECGKVKASKPRCTSLAEAFSQA